MSVSRLSARAFKAIATQQTRSMHQSGATTFSSLLTSDKPMSGQSYAPRIPASAVVPEATETGANVRHFNTSRSLKAVKDSSTVDFAYIPNYNVEFQAEPAKLRVPILPWTEPSAAMKHEFTEKEEPVSSACFVTPVVLFFSPCAHDAALTGYDAANPHRCCRWHTHPCTLGHLQHDR